MNTPTPPKAGLHPVMWVAAIAITLFSLVGIASLTGLLPGNKAAPPTEVATAPVPEPAPVVAPAVAPVAATPTSVPEKPAPAPVAKPKPKPKPHVQPEKQIYSSNPSRNESANEVQTYSSAPRYCPDCGVITAITPLREEGEGSGLGAIAGGVLGAVVGNQIGKGSGRDVARIAGIAGGAYAGHQIEKSQRAHTAYDITVRFDDGSTQRIRENAEPVWQVGDKVRVEGTRLLPR